MLTLTHRLSPAPDRPIDFTLSLTAEDRTRSRHYFETEAGQGIYLRLPRGTVLRHGELLQSEDQQTIVQVVAKPEPVMTVTATTQLDLLRAAYHLGNRHVPLEVREFHLRLSPDPVLKTMLQQMGLHVIEETAPFEPEAGAYGQGHSHESHIPDQPHKHDHHHDNHTHEHQVEIV